MEREKEKEYGEQYQWLMQRAREKESVKEDEENVWI